MRNSKKVNTHGGLRIHSIGVPKLIIEDWMITKAKNNK